MTGTVTGAAATRARRRGLSVTRAVLGKEFVVLWSSAVPYVTGAVLHAALGLLAVDTMQARQQAAFRPIVPIIGFLLLIVVPVLTMRTVAEERQTGTLDVLLAARLGALPLVVGKWLAVTLTMLILVAPAGMHVVLLLWWGDPDIGPMISGLVGLVLFAAAATAVGIACSAATSSQATAAVSASFVLLLGWFLRPTTDSVVFRTATARLSLNERLRSFAGGAVDSGDVVFLATATIIGVLVAGVLVSVVGGRRPRRLAAAGLAAAALVAAVVQWNVDDRRRLLDLTAEQALSLTEETRDVLDAVDQDVTITAFLRDDSLGRDDAAALLDRYEVANRRIRSAIVDPDTAPGEVRRLGIDPVFGGVALESDGGVEIVPSAIEQDLTLGLARLVRGSLPTVCVTVGHGELDPESRLPNGFASVVRILTDNGYRIASINPLTGAIPEECAAALVVGPASSLSSALPLLESHADAGGGVAVFLEPGFDAGLDGFLAARGIDALEGTVVEGDPESAFAGDPTAPLIRRYSAASPVVRNLPPTFFVTVGGFEVVADPVPGRTVSRLADTSEQSLLVEDLSSTETTARPGPITVAVASETVSATDGSSSRTRLVAVADADLVSNAFVGEAGNARLLVQIVDWLTVDADLVSVSPNLARDRPLVLTEARRDYARLLTAGLIPGAFLVAGGFVWAVRRGR